MMANLLAVRVDKVEMIVRFKRRANLGWECKFLVETNLGGKCERYEKCEGCEGGTDTDFGCGRTYREGELLKRMDLGWGRAWTNMDFG